MEYYANRYTVTYAPLYPKQCYELENLFFKLNWDVLKESRNNLVLSV